MRIVLELTEAVKRHKSVDFLWNGVRHRLYETGEYPDEYWVVEEVGGPFHSGRIPSLNDVERFLFDHAACGANFVRV